MSQSFQYDTCYGVDFSGAGPDNAKQVNIALATAVVKNEVWCVTVESGFSRDDIRDRISSSGRSIWALDFPFSLPTELTNLWFSDIKTAKGVWHAMHSVSLSALRVLAAVWKVEISDCKLLTNEAQHLFDACKPLECQKAEIDEPKRETDRALMAQSCIHTVNPDMMPMVHRGCAMLSDLGDSVRLLPWDEIADEEEPIVVETYPSAVRSAKLLGLDGESINESMVAAVLGKLGLRISIQGYDRTQRGDSSGDKRDAILACLTAIWLSQGNNLETHTQFLKNKYATSWELEGAIYVPLQSSYGDRVRQAEPRLIAPVSERPEPLSHSTHTVHNDEGKETNPDKAIGRVPRDQWEQRPDASYKMQCKLCGKWLKSGIDAHVRSKQHEFSYAVYRRLIQARDLLSDD